jgi:hypothetical protein
MSLPVFECSPNNEGNCGTLHLVQVRLTTLLPIFSPSTLICGPIDSKLSANERELNFNKVGPFPLKYRIEKGGGCYAIRSATLSTANLASFFLQNSASSLSEQLHTCIRQ